MKPMTALLAAIVTACFAPTAVADTSLAKVLRCSDGTTFTGRPTASEFATRTWVNDSPGSPEAVFIAFAGTVFASDGTVTDRWGTPAANRQGFINCVGERVEMTGKFSPDQP